MSNSPAADAPIEGAAGTSSEQAVETFSLLSNETRMAILLALWGAYEPWSETNAGPAGEPASRSP